jgi:hypothetical protein
MHGACARIEEDAMASDKQVKANRFNSKFSTGPKTSAGKKASSMNALKHGLRATHRIIAGENPADYAALQQGVYDEFSPQNAYQRALADEVADCLWWDSRRKRVEAGLLSSDLSGQAGLVEALIRLVKMLHEIGNEQFSQIVALARGPANPFSELKPDGPVDTSLNFERVLELVRPPSETASRLQHKGGIPRFEAARGKNQEESEVVEVDLIALFFSRNERFFSSLGRYSTSRLNKLVAIIQELRRCGES